MNLYRTTRRHISDDSDRCETYLVVERVLSQELHGLQMRVELVYDSEGLPQQVFWNRQEAVYSISVGEGGGSLRRSPTTGVAW
jgi:hypothetical protein